MKNVVVFHLFNDFSGSPMILNTVVVGLLKKGCKVDLVTSRGGVLDTIADCENLTRHHYSYNYSMKGWVTLLRYTWVQIYTFMLAFKFIFRKNTVFYINTLLPVGPALAGRIMGKRVVYHYHENANVKGTVYKELCKAMTHIADDIICVSAYQRNTLQDGRKATVVPNAVSDKFSEKLQPDASRAFAAKNILMACSAKMYKGVGEFMKIAEMLPQYRFTLVLNCDESEKETFLKDNNITVPANTTVFPRTDKMHEFYNKASVVLNLSDKEQFIETYGMTVAEAHLAGLPCIVPTEGGVAELVSNGENGYTTDSHETKTIAEQIDKMLSNENLFKTMSESALKSSEAFSEKKMVDSIFKIL